MKRLQNKVADSKLALPITAIYATGIWLLSGLIQENWWIQFGCFALSSFLIVEMNNIHSLIRIYSRMMSCAFLTLSCASCFLFPSLQGNICQVFVIATYLILFHTYQDKASTGLTYYGFLCLGLASFADIRILWFVPVWWLLMATNLQSLSWRTFTASILGVVTPYWLVGSWIIYEGQQELIVNHFVPLADAHQPFDLTVLTIHQIATIILIFILAVIGSIHFWRTSYLDKIRIRQLYSIFIRTDLLVFLLLLLQPQHADLLIRLMIINTVPLTAHFIALTHQRVTNAMFCVIVCCIIALTAYNLWL